MKAARLIGVMLGGLVAFSGLTAIIAAGAMAVVHATQRDDAGFYSTEFEQFATPTSALVAEVDLGEPDAAWPQRPIGTVRVTARDDRPLFIGVGPAQQVRGWLQG